MANGLVKWWRARFLAGYRPFSGTHTEGSDSEELLTGIPTTCNVSSPPPTESQPILISPAELPQVTIDGPSIPAGPIGNDQQPTCGTTKQLSFEEFECDVSVAEGDRKQEFSFTLYDFDGHGKITKDDIAGLVTTIYDTLGASIQVPPCGSKTIKVKLTVSPDQRTGSTSSQQQSRNAASSCLNATQTPQTTTSPGHHNSLSCCHLKHAAPCSHATATHTAHTARHGTPSSRVPRRRRVPRNRCQTERKEMETHSEDDDNARTNRMQQEELHKRVGPVPHLPSPYSNSSEGDVSDDSDTCPAFSPLTPLLTTNQKKRSGALQRQQLLEIIQANMEKNNLSFHTTRKRQQNEQSRIPPHNFHLETSNHNNVDCQTPAEPPQMTTTTTYHKLIRESTHHNSSFPKTTTAKSRSNFRKARHAAPRNNATPKNNVTHSSSQAAYTTSPHTLNRNLIVPTTVYNETPQHVTSGNITNTHRNIINLVPNNNQQTTNNHNNAQRNNAQFVRSNANQCSNRTTKKHQLKHATREQDQARAMAQVVRWLEREFSQNAVAATSGRRHVHEHIHHHYHHYHAEALV